MTVGVRRALDGTVAVVEGDGAAVVGGREPWEASASLLTELSLLSAEDVPQLFAAAPLPELSAELLFAWSLLLIEDVLPLLATAAPEEPLTSLVLLLSLLSTLAVLPLLAAAP